jgi:hypothetical protein
VETFHRLVDELDEAIPPRQLSECAHLQRFNKEVELDVPRTIFDKPGGQHFYDQIAWFAQNGNRSVLSLGFKRRQLRYPLWVKFSLRSPVRDS